MGGFDRDLTIRLLQEDPWATDLGIAVGEVDRDFLELVLDLGPGHLNFLEGTHGGVLFSLAELAASVAAGHRQLGAVTLDAHLALTAGSGEGDRLVARVEEVTGGRSLGTYRVTVTRADGRVAGLMTAVVRF